MEKLHERQIWLPVANVCATGLLIEQGEHTPISPFPVANGKVDRHPPKGTNVAGRAGIGIMWTSKTARQVYKNEWIFDKTTLRFIGEKTYDPGTGRLTGESAIIQQAFTAKAGQLP
jgi:hypothetical protein